MKVVLRGPERSLPTSVQYRSDRISSFDVEGEVALADVAAWAEKWRAAQFADLDAQEAVLRARYDMREPTPATAPDPVPDERLAELRRLARELSAHGVDPATVLPSTPKTLQAAQDAERKLRAALFDARQRK